MTKKAHIAIVVCVFLVATTWIFRVRRHAQWVTATPFEIQKVIDPQLLGQEPADRDAEMRFTRLVALLKDIDPRSNSGFPAEDRTPSERAQDAARFRVANQATLANILQLLEDGPYRRPNTSPMALVLDYFARGLAALISDPKATPSERRTYLAGGELLVARAFEGARTQNDFISACQTEGAIDASIVGLISRDGLTTKELRELQRFLLQNESWPSLERVLIADFQSDVLPVIGDPRSKYLGIDRDLAPDGSLREDGDDSKLPGNYDALRTAREVSDLYMEAIRQSANPSPKISTPVADRIAAIRKGLPELNYHDKVGADLFAAQAEFRKKMEAAPNSFAYLLLLNLDVRPYVLLRDQAVARHRLLAIQTECMLYVKEKGRLPATLSELVTFGYLPSVPVDPFASEPMHYDSRRGRIWTIGPGPAKRNVFPLKSFELVSVPHGITRT